MTLHHNLMESIKIIAEKNQANYIDLVYMYIHEKILESIYNSSYKECFIIKGGTILSTLFGINIRTTRDLDIMIKHLNLHSKEFMIVFQSILNFSNNEFNFKIVSEKDIRTKDTFGGKNIIIETIIERQKINISLDLTTKDPITPKEIKFKYPCLLENRFIETLAFNLETIIAEKLNIILLTLDCNKRIKDFFDLYLIITKYFYLINFKTLKTAVTNTFIRRNSFNILSNYKDRIAYIQKSIYLKSQWTLFQKDHPIASTISFQQTINIINFILYTLDNPIPRNYNIRPDYEKRLTKNNFSSNLGNK